MTLLKKQGPHWTKFVSLFDKKTDNELKQRVYLLLEKAASQKETVKQDVKSMEDLIKYVDDAISMCHHSCCSRNGRKRKSKEKSVDILLKDQGINNLRDKRHQTGSNKDSNPKKTLQEFLFRNFRALDKKQSEYLRKYDQLPSAIQSRYYRDNCQIIAEQRDIIKHLKEITKQLRTEIEEANKKK